MSEIPPSPTAAAIDPREIAMRLAQWRSVDLTGTALRALREGHAIGRGTLARFLGVSQPQLSALEQTEAAPDSEFLRENWRDAARLIYACGDVMRADTVGVWLTRSQDELDGHSPFEIFERGGPDALWELIREL